MRGSDGVGPLAAPPIISAGAARVIRRCGKIASGWLLPSWMNREGTPHSRPQAQGVHSREGGEKVGKMAEGEGFEPPVGRAHS